MSIRVLVLDRGALAADGVAALLRFMGHQVHTATFAETVLDAALAFRPDLALVDWTMPDAAQVCQALALSGTRIIAVGSEADARRLSDTTEVDVFGFLSTPCDRSKLSQVLASAEEDVFDCRDEARADEPRTLIGQMLMRRHWAYLARVTVFRLHGGPRDGQELFGNRAVELYAALDEEPLHRTFLACRRRFVDTASGADWVIERQRYVVESVSKSPDRILINARSLATRD